MTMGNLPLEEQIARVCHEANREYCATLGDASQPAWWDAPEWQRSSAVNGVQFHLAGDRSPAASHESWMREKLEAGWTYGPEKDPEAKTHPCLMPYEQLPAAQRLKDYLFKAIVDAFKAAQPKLEPALDADGVPKAVA